MTNAFEYADSLIEQPQAVKETNKNDEPSQKDPLSATEVSDNCVPGSPQVSNHEWVERI